MTPRRGNTSELPSSEAATSGTTRLASLCHVASLARSSCDAACHCPAAMTSSGSVQAWHVETVTGACGGTAQVGEHRDVGTAAAALPARTRVVGGGLQNEFDFYGVFLLNADLF